MWAEMSNDVPAAIALKPINGAVMVMRGLGVACFDAHGPAGEQIPELQISLATLWAEHAERCGYDANGVTMETHGGNWRLIRMENGRWNREQV